MIWRKYSRLTKIGLLLLPWLPAAAIFGAVWSHYPAQDQPFSMTMQLNGPSRYYSAAEQSEQMYPGIHLFALIAVVATTAFVVGLVLLLFAFVRGRRHSNDTKPFTPLT